jgi:hypothetical protein
MILVAHPVGDGSSIEIVEGPIGPSSLMDCGGDMRAQQVLRESSGRGLDSFLLTHLHQDHYDGITKQPASQKLLSDVKRLFLPILPLVVDFDTTFLFARALYTINATLGSSSGIPEQDLIDRFTALNASGVSPIACFLKKGDRFELCGHNFEVLWPPAFVDGSILPSVIAAIKAFDEAVSLDPIAREVREHLTQKARMAAEMSAMMAEALEGPSPPMTETLDSLPHAQEVLEGGDATADDEPNSRELMLSPELRSASAKIRAVANHLSLSFRSGYSFIHLGDLCSRELEQVIRDLGICTFYSTLIAAHHGTHSCPRMRSLNAHTTIVSNGQGMKPYFSTDYKLISTTLQETLTQGHGFAFI